MHAPGAEDRRAGRYPRDRGSLREGRCGGDARLLDGVGNGCRGELPFVGDRAGHLAEDLRLRRHLAYRLLDDRGEFLDDEDLFVPVDEAPEPLLIDRVGADDRERDVAPEHLLDVGGGDAARDDGGGAPDGVAVVAEFNQPFFERRLFFVQSLVQHPGVCGDDHVLLWVAVEGGRPVFCADLADTDVALRVADTGGWAEDNRQAELLGESEGVPYHIVGFLDRCRVETGEPGEVRVAPCILLVLGTVCKGVVRREEDEPAGHPGVCARHQGIGGHVQPDVFHGAECAQPAPGGGECILEGDLLVRGPLHGEGALLLNPKDVDHFGGRRSRVAAGKIDICFQACMSNALVPE